MYFKLSLKNVKKSFKDYALYFLTLTFAVCIFYIFNSIDAQKAMMNISQSTDEIMKLLTQLMGTVSIFISIILGFLIVYANNFIIRRRKKEIGVYMTLGMDKGKVARLLLSETFIIGVLSLGAGLLAGIFLSQGFSIITAKLFEVDLSGYRFIFSLEAFAKTVIYFGIIFLIVMVMSTISISKYKLIDLINAEKQNEKQRFKNPVITVILFILSVVCIGTAYAMVLKNGLMPFDEKLVIEILLGASGTFLFFASLSGFFLKLMQANKKVYRSGLNTFILRQINARINTAHISISFICLMLFCTIGILSTGMGINNAINKIFNNSTPYDASLYTDGGESIKATLDKYGFNINNYTDSYVEFSVYKYAKEDLTSKIIFEKVEKYIQSDVRQYGMQNSVYIIKLSDYNRLLNLQGKGKIDLSESQVAIYSDFAASNPEFKGILQKFIDIKQPITISGKNYEAYNKVLCDSISTSPSGSLVLGLIVPDKLTEGSSALATTLCFNCKGDSKAMQIKFQSDINALAEDYKNKNKDKKDELKIYGTTKESIKSFSAGSTATIAFVGIYLGIIFILTSAAILALQQLSEAADNRHRYKILQKVGADDTMINSALFKQIAIYFMLPLALAAIHSIVGIKVANDVIKDAGKIDATGNIIMTALLIAIVYGAYFIATYISSKRIILRGRV